MSQAFIQQLQQQIDDTKAQGLYKEERVITSQQFSSIEPTII
jgi:glycine C-acetyltransferase